MIRSFSDKEAEKLLNRERSRKLPPYIQPIARRKLEMIHAAGSLQDLRNPPSNHLEKLKGGLKRQIQYQDKRPMVHLLLLARKRSDRS